MLSERCKKILKSGDIKVSSIISKLAGYEYVSFDIFDTLIKRDVEKPSDVFTIAQRIFEKRNGKKIHTFKEARIEAERLTREKSSFPEVTIDEIYENINLPLTNLEKTQLKEIEIEAEVALCCANRPIKQAFDYCIENGKKVIIISDMYLPQNVVEKILSNAGYRGYKALYLSSTCKAKKRNGELFRYALQDQRIKKNQIVHIGDSPKADFLQSRKLGIHSIYIPQITNRLQYDKLRAEAADRFALSCIRAFINNHIGDDKDDYYKFGYELFGILLYGFNKWLIENMRKENISDAFFFSRDGHIIKRAFDVLNSQAEFTSHYFYVSRRSLRVPQYWINAKYEQILEAFPGSKWITVKTFIENLGLEPEGYSQLMKQYGLSTEQELKKTELNDNDAMRSFYERIRGDVIKHSLAEYDVFVKYMKQEELEGRVAVIDIGWVGNMQYFIQEISTRNKWNLESIGYYVGLAKEARKDIPIKGYVIDEDSATGSCDCWRAFDGLIESVFLSQEGSVRCYTDNTDGKIVPLLYQYEFADSEGEICGAAKVASIQNGAIDFVRDISGSILADAVDYSSTTAFSGIRSVGTQPSGKELDLFADFCFREGRVNYLVRPKSRIYYIFHPKQLKNELK